MYYYSTKNIFFFWSRENNEPVHILVAKGKPSKNSAKFWLKAGGVELAENKANIPAHELNKLRKYIAANRNDIIAAWYDYCENMK